MDGVCPEEEEGGQVGGGRRASLARSAALSSSLYIPRRRGCSVRKRGEGAKRGMKHTRGAALATGENLYRCRRRLCQCLIRFIFSKEDLVSFAKKFDC